MIGFVLILSIAIVNCVEPGAPEGPQQTPKSPRRWSYKESILPANLGSLVWCHFTDMELMRMIYDPQGSNVHKKQIAVELHTRVDNTLNFKEKRELLYEMDRRRKGHSWPDFVKEIEDKIAQNVRMVIQERVNQKCKGHPDNPFCELTFEQVNNDLLETLENFDQHVIVPSHVQELRLGGLSLTSLWLKFNEDSQIYYLDLAGNNFKALNYDTFGRNDKIEEIDVDQIKIRDLRFLDTEHCDALREVKNIPVSLTIIHLKGTAVVLRMEHFKQESGNKLKRITCNKNAAEAFKKLLEGFHPEKTVRVYSELLTLE